MNENKSQLIKQLNTLLEENADDIALLNVAKKLTELLEKVDNAGFQGSKTEQKKTVNHKKLIEKELSYFQTFVEGKNVEDALQSSLENTKDTHNHDENFKNSHQEITQNFSTKNLKSVISINDRYLYINQLFGGNATEYEQSIETINHFSNLQECVNWIEKSLRHSYLWDENDKTVKQFYKIIERKFS